LLPDSFITYLPKDGIGGDVYWVEEVDDKVLFSSIDATGHGIPGALISIMGVLLLNDTVLKKKIAIPNEILTDVRLGIMSILKQNENEQKLSDGVDAALCSWDKKNNILEYAGANTPLLLVRSSDNPSLSVQTNLSSTPKMYSPIREFDGQSLYEIKPDRFPVGVGFSNNDLKTYTNHTLKLYPGDTIYIFSDGFKDQFGSEYDKRYGSNQFKKLLLSIYKEGMKVQGETLLKTHKEWKGSVDQTDDICVLGVRV